MVCLAGILINGWAGMSKQRELPARLQKAVVREFNFRKGVLLATFCGIASACMAYGFAAGRPIAELAVQRNTPGLWRNLPVLVVVLLGGFTTNAVWCVALNMRNGTWGDYFSYRHYGERSGQSTLTRTTVAANYLFAMLAGSTWYMQFFFYSMGTTKMGAYGFSSWTLHMASIMIFGTLCGVLLREWAHVSRRTQWLVVAGLLVLVASTLIVGYGNYLALGQPGN
jgi:L-rhamnose-H+ transport protein